MAQQSPKAGGVEHLVKCEARRVQYGTHEQRILEQTWPWSLPTAMFTLQFNSNTCGLSERYVYKLSWVSFRL